MESTRRVPYYTTAVAALSGIGFLVCAVRVALGLAAWPAALAVAPYCLMMTLLMVVGRVLPISLPQNYTLRISFVPVLACILTSSLEVAVTLYGFSALFFFSAHPVTHKPTYLWRLNPIETLFRAGCSLCSILIAGMPLALWGRPTELLSLQTLAQTFVFSLLSMTSLLLLRKGRLRWAQTESSDTAQPRTNSMVFHLLSTMTLSILLALVLEQPHGYFFVLVFLAPLALARYSFNLYVESRSICVRTMAALSLAIEIRDTYTQGHSRRVAYYSTALARALHKPDAYVDEIRVAALLHDIGKMGVSDAVLNKPGALTDEEYTRIQAHSRLGYNIIQGIHLSPAINDAVLHHHRRYDGGGYPVDLRGTPIPSRAAILAVADTYDAMTSDRPYRSGMPREAAVAELKRVAGTQLDPELVDVFVTILPQLDPALALESAGV